jgi:hypothetical protein
VTRVDEANSEAKTSPAPVDSDAAVGVIGETVTANGKPTGKTARRRGGGNSWTGAGGGSGWSGAWGSGGVPAEAESEMGTVLFRLYSDNTAGLVTGVSQVLAEAGAEVRDLHLKKPSLEDVFIYLTGRNLR